MSSDNYHIAAEADLKPSVNRRIWFFLISMSLLLFLTMLGLTIMYRFQLLGEKEEKIGDLISNERLDQQALSEAYLSGKLGIFTDKSHVPINEAVIKFLADIRAGK